MMSLIEKFGIKSKDVISIVGSGGKTTTIFLLAKEISQKGKVLVITTTKMFIPESKDVEFLDNADDIINYQGEKKIIAFGKRISNCKFGPIDDEELNFVKDKFENILIEADGSKGHIYKGWRDFEPVIHKETNKTIGIIPALYLNRNLPEELIFASDLFKKNFEFNEVLNFKVLKNIIYHKDGIFKNALGEKIVYFNQVKNINKLIITREFIRKFKKVDHSIIYAMENLNENHSNNFGKRLLQENGKR